MSQSESPFIAVLEREFSERKRKNARFSLRAFANQLGINVSTLSRLLRRQRSPSPAMIRALSEKLNFNAAMTEQLVLADVGARSDPFAYESELKTQTTEETRDMAGWEYLAIQALLETDVVVGSTQQMATLLGITALRARRCVETLSKHQMVFFHQGRWKSTYKRVIAYRKGNAPVVQVLAEFQEMGRRKLLQDDGDHQTFSGMVMAVDPRKIPEAERRVREFRNNLAQFLGEGHKSEVYRIGIELFPLTNRGRPKK